MTAADVGEAGSLSRVRRMYIPDKGRAQLIEGDAAEQAARLAEIIREFKGAARMSGMLVIAEQRRGELRPVSLELVECGAGAAPRRRGSRGRRFWRDAPERFVGRLERRRRR